MKWNQMQPQRLCESSGIHEWTNYVCEKLGLSRSVASSLATRIYENLSASKEVVNRFKSLYDYFSSIGCNQYFVNLLLDTYLKSRTVLSQEQIKNRIYFLLGIGYPMEEIFENISIVFNSSISLEKIYFLVEKSKRNKSLETIDDETFVVGDEDSSRLYNNYSLTSLKKCELISKGNAMQRRLTETSGKMTEFLKALNVNQEMINYVILCLFNSINVPSFEQVSSNIYFSIGRGYSFESVMSNIGLFLKKELSIELLYALFESCDNDEMFKVNLAEELINARQKEFLLSVYRLRKSYKIETIRKGKNELEKSKK